MEKALRRREAEEQLKALEAKRVVLEEERDAKVKEKAQLELRRMRAAQSTKKTLTELAAAVSELQVLNTMIPKSGNWSNAISEYELG